MSETKVNIKTADGTCDCYTYTAPGDAPAPAVILYMDGIGIRPELRAMAQRLASNGYFVLLPNMYYRAGDYPPLDVATMLTDETQRNRMMALVQSVTNAGTVRDTTAFLDFLSKEPRVKGSKVGCVGYCMGGPLVLTAVGTFPDRMAAGASIHGANLANDRPDSPHLLAPKIKASYYFAIAANDDQRQPDAKDKLREAFASAHQPIKIEVYQGCQHGWCVSDGMVYDKTEADRAFGELVELYKRALI